MEVDFLLSLTFMAESVICTPAVDSSIRPALYHPIFWVPLLSTPVLIVLLLGTYFLHHGAPWLPTEKKCLVFSLCAGFHTHCSVFLTVKEAHFLWGSASPPPHAASLFVSVHPKLWASPSLFLQPLRVKNKVTDS